MQLEPVRARPHGCRVHRGTGAEELRADLDPPAERPRPRARAHPDLEAQRGHRSLQRPEVLDDLVAVAPVLDLGKHVALDDEERLDAVHERTPHLALDREDVPIARGAHHRRAHLGHVVRDPRGERVRGDAHLLERVVGDEDVFPAALELEVGHARKGRRIDLAHLDPGAGRGGHRRWARGHPRMTGWTRDG